MAKKLSYDEWCRLMLNRPVANQPPAPRFYHSVYNLEPGQRPDPTVFRPWLTGVPDWQRQQRDDGIAWRLQQAFNKFWRW